MLYAQNTEIQPEISGSYNHENISHILTNVGIQYHIRFYYKTAWLLGLTATLEVRDKPLTDFLDTLLQPVGLTYVFYNSSAVIIAKSQDLEQEFTQNYFINKRRQQNFLRTNNLSLATDHITLGDTTSNVQEKEALITGTVTDGQTDLPLNGVNIDVESVNKILTTDADGKFSITLPTGLHFITVSYVGYETKKYDLVLKGNAPWKIELFSKTIQLKEVEISGSQEESVVHSTIAGITKLSSRDIKTVPVFMGEADVIKSILTMPGVSTTGEGTEGFHVRGGNTDQNLVLQDDGIIFNSSHALGFFSVFNPDMVSNVTLYKGHIPAQYGGRISSVLDVNLKGFNEDKPEIDGGIGFVTSKLSVNTPLFNKNMTILAGGRITYSDWILKKTNVPDIQHSAASFYDFNIKVIQKLPHHGSLSASAYQSYDHVQFATQFGFKWKNEIYGFTWGQLFMNRFMNKLSYNFGRLTNNYINPGTLSAYILTNGLSYHKAKEELSITTIPGHDITAGLEGILYLSSPDRIDPYLEKSQVIPQSVTRENGLETAVFINDEYTINHLFSLSAGFRFNYFESLGPATVYDYKPGETFSTASITDSVTFQSGQKTITFGRPAPRLALKYNINAVSSLKASYNRMNQFMHLISNTVSPIPVDLWQVSNRYILPESANNYSLGYFRSLGGSRYEASLDLYYRTSNHIPLYKDFADLGLNQHIETEIIDAHGESYGAEFYIRKLTGNPTGWLSYTYSKSIVRSGTQYPETTVNNGDWFSTYYDKPHQLNIVFNVKITRGADFALNYTYSSGRPITAPTAEYYYDYYFIPYYPGRNEYRIPYYSRLDAALTIRRNVIRNHRYTDSFTFSVYNILSRDNAFSIFFRKDNNLDANAYKLSVLGKAFPSVTYNFKF